LKEADLSARIKPINVRLARIAEQKAKLADDWIVRHMNNDKFKELRDNLDKEESRIKALKSEIDPAQIDELENTKGILRFWENLFKSMAWNTENEDGSMVRLVDRPHYVALKLIGFDDRAISNTLAFPATKRDTFNKLQMRLVVFNDRIEVNGLFLIEPINIQWYTSTGLRWGARMNRETPRLHLGFTLTPYQVRGRPLPLRSAELTAKPTLGRGD